MFQAPHLFAAPLSQSNPYFRIRQSWQSHHSSCTGL
jgi:hypothetical protein